jgi:hypothetical protein
MPDDYKLEAQKPNNTKCACNSLAVFSGTICMFKVRTNGAQVHFHQETSSWHALL